MDVDINPAHDSYVTKLWREAELPKIPIPDEPSSVWRVKWTENIGKPGHDDILPRLRFTFTSDSNMPVAARTYFRIRQEHGLIPANTTFEEFIDSLD